METACLHLGILPHKNINAVVDIISKYFSDIPFWAQLPNYSSVEGKFLQFLTPIPGVKNDLLKKKYYIDTQSYTFQTKIPGILKDYNDITIEKLEKYKPNSVFFDYFLRIIDEYKPKYAKGQIIGPITMGLLLTDETGTPAIENHKVMDVITKACILQCISQICEMKKIHPAITPIIFIDESELGKAYQPENSYRNTKAILSILKSLVKSIKDNGGTAALMSSSCTDWNFAINADFNIICINTETQFVTLLNKELRIDKFLNSGGKIAWNLLPNNPNRLKTIDVSPIFNNYIELVSRLKNFHKLHRSLILSNSLVTIGNYTPELTDTLAEKSITLGLALADKIKQEAAAIVDENSNY